MFGRGMKIILIVVFIGLLAYLGSCVYATCLPLRGDNGPQLPDVDKATYAVTITNTGNLLFTDKYDLKGDVYILHGFWSWLARNLNTVTAT